MKIKNGATSLLVLEEHYLRLPATYFGDPVHLNETGLAAYRPVLQMPLKELMTSSLNSHRKELQKRFSSGVSLLKGETKNHTSSLTALHDATLHQEEGSLRILATGKDPALILPATEWFKPKDDERAVAFFLLECDKPTIAKLYYSFSDKFIFSEKNSQSKRIQPGKNKLYFVLPQDFKGGTVRFDPGDVEGQYVLHLLEIRLVETGQSYRYIDDLILEDTP